MEPGTPSRPGERHPVDILVSEVRELEIVLISHLGDHVGEEVRVAGWVYNRRSSGKIQFILIRDGAGVVQAVMGRNDVLP